MAKVITYPSPLPDLLDIRPKKITIPLRLNEDIPVSLELKNTSSQPVAFKVKTTAPERYLVRPTQGLLRVNESVGCQIVMTKLSQFPDRHNPKLYKDKFLVQAVCIDQSPSDLGEMWKQIEAAHQPKSGKHVFNGQQIKCKLIHPDEETQINKVPESSSKPTYKTSVDEKMPRRSSLGQTSEPPRNVVLPDGYSQVDRNENYEKAIGEAGLLNIRTRKLEDENRSLRQQLAQEQAKSKQLEAEVNKLRADASMGRSGPESGLRRRPEAKIELPGSSISGPGISGPSDKEKKSGSNIFRTEDSVISIRGWLQIVVFLIICFVLGRISVSPSSALSPTAQSG